MNIFIKRINLLLVSLLFGATIQAQQIVIFESEHLPVNDTVWVYWPQSKAPAKGWPTVVLLHGFGGTHRQWPSLADLQALANKYRLAIVCPDGLKNSWYWNSPDTSRAQWDDFWNADLMPKLRHEWPVDTTNLFIDGLSMGGHGAITLFLKHPQWFAGVGSSSGVLDLAYSGLRNSDLKDQLGEYERERWLPRMAIGLLDRVAPGKQIMFIDCGAQDYLIEANRKFVEKAKKLGWQVHYSEPDGKHERSYWAKNIEPHLAFFYNIAYPNTRE